MKIDQSIKIAVDAILFGYQENQLFVLLIKQRFGKLKNKWALPGGFVKNKEGLSKAIHRELKDETGVKVESLEQLYTFGDNPKRDPRGQVITVAYFGTVNPKNMKIVAGSDASDVSWVPISDIPALAFDHNHIIKVALDRLKSKLNYQPIGFQLLDKKFPFSDLENLYTTILDKEIDRRNFRKKILSFGFLIETDELQKKDFGRPGKLFKFDKVKYKQLLKDGINFEIKFA